MQHYFNQKDIQINTEKGSVVALGKFDGFHQGHKLLLDEVLRLQRDGYTGVVFTFDIRKNSIFDVDKLQSIITSEEKCMLAEQMGIDVLVEYPFDDAFASMEPEAFVTDILVKRLHAGYVVVGTDYGFGKKKRGNVELLRKMAGEYGYQVIVIEKKKIHDVRANARAFIHPNLYLITLGVSISKLLKSPVGGSGTRRARNGTRNRYRYGFGISLSDCPLNRAT